MNCSANSTLLEPRFLAVNLLWCSSSLVSFVMCFVATLLGVYRFCWKTKTVSTERTEKLLLYLVTFSMVYSFVNCFQWLRLLVQYGKPETKVGCAIVGFGIQYLGTGILVITFCIGIHLLLLVCRPKCLNSAIEEDKLKRYRTLELGYIISAIVVPALLAPWPWINYRYGPAGYWCWIQAQDENCNWLIDGFIQQIVLGFLWVSMQMAFATVVAGVTLGLLCYYRKKKISLGQKDNYIYIKICTLLFYLVVRLVAIVIGCTDRLIQWKQRESPYPLLIVHTLVDPLWESLGAIVMYLVVYYNWKRMNWYKKSKTLLQQTKGVTIRTSRSYSEETDYETKYHHVPQESYVDKCVLDGHSDFELENPGNGLLD